MKNIFLSIVALFCTVVYAQNNPAPLHGTMWYLTSIEENNVIHNIPPYNGFEKWIFQILPVVIGGIPSDDSVSGEYCFGFTGPINVENNFFNFIDSQFATTMNTCPWLTTPELNLMNKQVAFYQNYLQDIFQFQINNFGLENELIITNVVGNKAYYSDIPTEEYLATEKFQIESQIIVYPNPANEKIFISLPDDAFTKSIKVFSIDMKEIGIIDGKTIDVSTFSSGIYIIAIEFSDKKIYKKFVVN